MMILNRFIENPGLQWGKASFLHRDEDAANDLRIHQNSGERRQLLEYENRLICSTPKIQFARSRISILNLKKIPFRREEND